MGSRYVCGGGIEGNVIAQGHALTGDTHFSVVLLLRPFPSMSSSLPHFPPPLWPAASPTHHEP